MVVKMKSAQYYALLYWFSIDEEINKDDFRHLSKDELHDLVLRFPYRISMIIKYGNNKKWFDGKLIVSKFDDCWDCGKDMYQDDDRYELDLPSQGRIEFLCPKCWNSKRTNMIIERLFGKRTTIVNPL